MYLSLQTSVHVLLSSLIKLTCQISLGDLKENQEYFHWGHFDSNPCLQCHRSAISD